MDITVTDAVLIARENSPNIWVIAKEVRYDTGSIIRMAQAFPEDTLEWRVAEYDLDPNDKDTLIDILLYEHHLDDDIDPDHPSTLAHAVTIKEAREFHLQRIKDKKGTGKVKTRKRDPSEKAITKVRSARYLLIDSGDDPDTPLDILKRELPIDPDLVEVKREHVRQQREAVRSAGRQSKQMLRARPSKEELKQKLLGRSEHRQ
jgi:hypothetical protein